MNLKRRSGILLHPTSLPGPGGIGTLGEEAFEYVDFLERAGQSLWQVLPLGPVAYGNSPYSCYSAFAGNPLLIDTRKLAEQGDIEDPFPSETDLGTDKVDYDYVRHWKIPLLHKAAASFFENGEEERRREYEEFCSSNSWLEDFAHFMALKEQFKGKGWAHWPRELAGRSAATLAESVARLEKGISARKYMQWQFFRQWRALKEYANGKGVLVIGDIPIFVAYDSAEVWSHPEFFNLDEQGNPIAVAGVPPDYFSETGQLWGNPLYRWDTIAEDGFSLWIERLKSSLLLYDYIRIDHFRGFAAYWEVPATEKTAINGRWVPGPGEKLFNSLRDALGDPLPILAEDLGLITPDVEELRDQFRFPGMKVLQFAFGYGHDNYYLPHNFSRCYVAYTGTHDNNTTRGWFNEAGENERQHALHYLRCSENEVVWEMIRATLGSVASYAVVPFQDLFGLGADCRMNIPGVGVGNWEWRMSSAQLRDAPADALREMTEFFNRIPKEDPKALNVKGSE